MKKRHKQSVGEDIIESLTEVRDGLRAGKPLSTFYSRVQIRQDLEPGLYTAKAVRAIRQSLHASQVVFGMLMGVTVHAVQSWEQGKQEPSAMARRLLDEMQANPGRWRAMLERVA
jgi:DNA-binding transcriptional regulator YiaG